MREGASIGPYRVLRKIGEGGLGTVFLGEHTLLGRHAAIKILLPELSSKRDSVDRFFDEVRATTAISDPGIVQVFDFGSTPDDVAYIVMELLEGEPLNQRLRRLSALLPEDALRITRQVAGTLDAAHAAGIVHYNLKPKNLYMVRDPEAPGGERPKILDFGVAKLGDDMPDRIRTQTGAVLGAPVYMSPEQCDGAIELDHRADIYSLGCILFHLLTGRPPFDLTGVGAIVAAHLHETPPLPSSLVALPPGLDEIVMRCLAKQPGERFPTMLALQQACDAILAVLVAGRPATSPAEPPAAPLSYERSRIALGASAGAASGRTPRRRFRRWLVVAALAVGTGSMIAVLTSRSGRQAAAVAPRTQRAAVVLDAGLAAEPPDASAAPVTAAATAPLDATVAEGAEGAEPEVDAVVGAAVKSATAPSQPARPVRRPRPSAVHKPAATKPAATKPVVKKPVKSQHEDLYDDRN